MPPAALRVALVGNPNTGKSTLFNALSGLRQHVGNYPGVTVDLKTGRFRLGETDVTLIDLPGTYSLAPRSPDEMVAVDLLLGRLEGEPPPDLILAIIDASNIDRHLYLTTQLMELGLPLVVAVTMTDTAAAQGIRLDAAKLAAAIGVPVVPVHAARDVGLDALRKELCRGGRVPTPPPFPAAVAAELDGLAPACPGVPRFLVQRLLFDVGGHVETWLTTQQPAELPAKLTAARERLAAAGCAVPGVEARTRYGWIRQATAAAVTKPTVKVTTRTDRIDRILTHKVWGTLAFLFVMFLVFQSIFVWAGPLMDLLDGGRGFAAGVLESHMDDGPLRSFLIDGVLKGVGGVVIFLPQIALLFAFIAVLEDCGYMARAAFLMDKVMSRCGLNGKSFIPLLSSVACAVPGILSTRVIENRRDRLATILVAPLMSCSARLPVYALFIGTFLTDGFPWWLPGLVLFGMYLIGFVTAPLVALLLKRTLLRGATPLFVMELPAYKLPQLRGVLWRVWDACTAFVYRAGTVILASMVLIWASLYFPTRDPAGDSYPTRIAAAKAADDGAAAAKLEGEWRRGSYLGSTGRALEPAFTPLGWDWKIGMAALASFPAREVMVGTFGILYDVGEVDAGEVGNPDDAAASGLKRVLRDEWAADPVRGPYGVAVALSILVFFALCCQCASTLAVIRRETRSWAWPAFTFTYMTVLAYLGAFATFQIGRLITDTVP
jgi:ferrous iron transport protein B